MWLRSVTEWLHFAFFNLIVFIAGVIVMVIIWIIITVYFIISGVIFTGAIPHGINLLFYLFKIFCNSIFHLLLSTEDINVVSIDVCNSIILQCFLKIFCLYFLVWVVLFTDDSGKSSIWVAREIISAFKILVGKSSPWAEHWLVVSSGLAVSLTSLFSVTSCSRRAFSLLLKAPLGASGVAGLTGGTTVGGLIVGTACFWFSKSLK